MRSSWLTTWTNSSFRCSSSFCSVTSRSATATPGEASALLDDRRHHGREGAARDPDLLGDPGPSLRIGAEPAHEVERVEAERVLEPGGAEGPFGRRAEHPPRGGVRHHLVVPRHREQEPVRHALDDALDAVALRGEPGCQRSERGGDLVDEHVEHTRVPLAERLVTSARDEDDPRRRAGDVHRQREPGREAVDASARARSDDAHPQRTLVEGRAAVLAVGGERVLPHGGHAGLGELGARADDEVGRRVGRDEEHRRDVAGDDAREPLHDALEDPRVALGRAHVARDLGRGLERLQPPLGLGVEPLALAPQLHLLERAQHRLPQIGVLPGLHEVAVDLALVDGVDDLAGVGVRGEEDRAEIGIVPARRLDERDPGHAGHALVGDEQVHRSPRQDLERLGAARGGERLVAILRGEAAAQDREHVRLVVDEEDDVRHRGDGAPRRSGPPGARHIVACGVSFRRPRRRPRPRFHLRLRGAKDYKFRPFASQGTE